MELDLRNRYFKYSLFVIAIALIIRLIPALVLEFGNDEVYYWLYVKYPALSYFDHPARMAVLMRLFTFDLFFDNELALRMAALIPVTVNGFLMYFLLKRISSAKAGFYGVILYYSSLYVTAFSGTFIIPDGPLSTMWLLALILFIRWEASRKMHYLLLAGFVTGLAISTKYHAVFLWFGMGGYIIFSRIKTLKSVYFYLAILLTIVGTLPLIIWNIQNDWQSFAFHQDRIGFSNQLKPYFLLRELAGQLFINNIILVILILIAIYNIHKINLGKNLKRILFWFSAPIILTFLISSLFKPTLPHWSAPGYYPLIILAAIYLSSLSYLQAKKWLISSFGLMVLILYLSIIQINYGFFYSNHETNQKELGKNDLTLDLFGWEQSEKYFSEYIAKNGLKTKKIVDKKWFNAAHIDYYICRPNNLIMISLGDLNDAHEYIRINKIRGGISQGEDAYFFAFSRFFIDPNLEFSNDFEKISFLESFPIMRNGETVEYFYLYLMENYNKK